jgi:hypothetical protein
MSGVRRSAGAGQPLVLMDIVEITFVNAKEVFVIPGPQDSPNSIC